MTDDDTGNEAESEAEDTPGDPFDALGADAYRDRRGDPFESLGDGRRGDAPRTDPDADDRRVGGSGPGTDPSPRSSTGNDREDATETKPEPEPELGPERGADPFTYPDEGGASGDHGEGNGRVSGDGDRDGRTAGENVDVPSGDPFGDIDRDGENPFESGTGTFDRVDVDAVDPDEVWERMAGGSTDAATAADEEVEVSKHAYCEGCEYFSSPPDAHCTNGDTEILEFVDMETVRVVNCPVVAERRELGRE